MDVEFVNFFTAKINVIIFILAPQPHTQKALWCKNNENLSNQKTHTWHKAFELYIDVMETTNDQPWQNSIYNFVFWRGDEFNCQVAKFLPHRYKKGIKVSFEIQIHYKIALNMS